MIHETICRIDLIRGQHSSQAYLALGALTAHDEEKLLSALSAEELVEYQAHLYDKRKYEYGLGRYVAKKSIMPFLPNEKPQAITIGKGVFNQPIIYCTALREKIQVSISHAGNVAVSLAFPEEHPMGIDIEKISKEMEEALISQLLEKEIAGLREFGLPDHVGFTMLWTVKEALSKVLRTGLTVPLPIFSVKQIHKTREGYWCEFEHFLQYKTFSWMIADFICTICLPKNTIMQLEHSGLPDIAAGIVR